MPSYFKTQGWRLLIALTFFVPAIVMLVQSADTSTLEGTVDTITHMFGAICYILAGMFWVVTSLTEHNSECVKYLEKQNRDLERRIEKLEERAITDIDTIGPNDFIVRRRLGPDKDVPPPPPKSGSNIEKPEKIITVKIVGEKK